MKTLKPPLFYAMLFLGAISLCGCLKPVQILDIASTQVEQYADDVYAFENDTLAIAYDFWTEGGIMLFSITNKTKEDIFIDFSKSYFKVNDKVFDYFSDLQRLAGKHENLPSKIEEVPAQSSKTIEGYPVTFEWQPISGKPPHYFRQSDTPIRFSTRFVYSNDPEFAIFQVVQNDFWVNRIEKMHKRDFIDTDKDNSPKSHRFFIWRIISEQNYLWLDIASFIIDVSVFF